jgi:GrpB protein
MADQSIELTAYDPTWPVRFAEQQTRLAALLKPWLAGEIEHVGSTSVPGLRSSRLSISWRRLCPLRPLARQSRSWEGTGGCFGRTTPMGTIVSGSCDRALRRALITRKSSNMIIRIFEH